ncbi:phenylalanine--tRNA ligase alpha subunit [Cyanidioschyzon merolae strain 10D]|jgi:phenylalanyl-tRNA synthetase alpha chain|uniref:phenylalanine--tRNA ligase n=1 Tax=Cyanidioschyzon merolae (strain NIES-3377 / 10D) TaxID=280699 RepID=M1V7X6_CYAM1|nr:phenylalanine--tRNA ligase alpha subunit [Cyanidioschyzon merolae strain 10D]BAM80149.1 phenylalanine--tRNA ligase alpha subunit [Cyanidioschyzon merolae strain 10D]|eukprot:XP_005536435.1 phenylalanine--tRNA ligase alpha subunit [Cyanidioschyzon merolae strain 10D]
MEQVELEHAIVEEIRSAGKVANSRAFAERLKVNHEELVAALNSMYRRDLVTLTQLEPEVVLRLTAEGALYAQHGTPEWCLREALERRGPTPVSELDTLLEEFWRQTSPNNALDSSKLAKIGMQQGLKLGLFELDKRVRPPCVACVGSSDSEAVHKLQMLQKSLRALHSGALTALSGDHALDAALVDEILRRNLATRNKLKVFAASAGPRFEHALVEQLADLTREMLLSESWRNATFKEFNFEAAGVAPVDGGRLHPLLKVREEFRLIFLEMGFTEMPSNQYVESSFWNFDALFQPQQHPARDAHDTFFLNEPALCKRIGDASPATEAYVERVRGVHDQGGYGSRGYGYAWDHTEAMRNVLRTHTTAISARMLYRMARELQDGRTDASNFARRMFSIDRVFRNETLDATHLCEFHQVEGWVAGPDLSLADLKGIISQFFRRIGMHRLRFKPTYNPYTEPSMEIYAYHEALGRWVEIGNSGIFRPEMLQPMGLPPNIQVIAWGLSLERPTMILYGLSNIRDLFGHRVSLQTIRDNPICRLGW